MPIDATADLLFRIGANTDDAESNLQRFRTIFSKDLSDIGGEFEDWATKTFGTLDSVAAIATAGTAALATAIVTVGAAANAATNHYVELVSEVARGSHVTGIAVEEMSGLKFAAEATGTHYDSLVSGLTRFTSTIVRAADGSHAQAAAFARLGISQEQVKSGEQNMLPLLLTVAERFHGLASGVDKAAMARELFGRGGAEMLGFLNQGAAGIQRLTEEARKMGVVIGKDDRDAVRSYRAELQLLKDEQDAVDVVVARSFLPLKRWWEDAKIAAAESFMATISWKTALMALANPAAAASIFLGMVRQEMAGVREEVDRMVKSQPGDEPLAPLGDPEKIEKAAENFEGLSEVLERLNGELAGFGSEEGQAEEKVHRMLFEMGKAVEELKKKQAAGDLAPGVFAREMAAWEEFAAKMPQLYDELMSQIAQRRNRAANDAETELRGRIAKEQEQTRAQQEKEFEAEVDAQEQGYRARKDIALKELPALLALSEAWRAAGLAKMREGWAAEDLAASEHDGKVADEKKAAFDAEMARLNEETAKIEREHMTREQWVEAQYAADVAKYSAAEEKKSLATETEETKRAAIRAQFGAMRTALYNKEQVDLQDLVNSRGWRGVFGAEFAAAIRGNEALSKEWAASMSQGAMMVRVALESLGEMGQKSFEGLASGMGQNIAHAAVFGGSIEKAMRQALGATLESIAAQAMVQAIYATGLGFLDLALGDYEAAGQAFAAAAIFGSVGAAAAVSGRAVVGSQTTGAGGQGSGAGARGGAPAVGQFGSDMAARSKNAQAGFQVGGTAAGVGGPHLTVNIQGSVIGPSGVTELCGMLNDAVLNKGATLTSTNTKTGVQITR